MGSLINLPTILIVGVWSIAATALARFVFLPWLGMVPFLATWPKGLLAVVGFILAILVVWVLTIIGCVLYVLYKGFRAQHSVNQRIATR